MQLILGDIPVEDELDDQLISTLLSRQLDGGDGSVAVLVAPNEHFIQVAGGPKYFLVEHQEGALERHFRLDSVAELGQVIAAFQKYAKGDQAWRDIGTWGLIDPTLPTDLPPQTPAEPLPGPRMATGYYVPEDDSRGAVFFMGIIGLAAFLLLAITCSMAR